MNQAVHQIRYCWSPASLLGTRGMGPVESTVPENELTTWDRYLRDHVWAADAEPGFTFIVGNGVGMLLRKVAKAAADGRPGSAAHALLSPQMTAREALGLTLWEGWDAPALSVLPWPALQPAADRGLDVLRARAQVLPAGRLAGLFAQLLKAPGDGFTVIGESEPLAMTCAFGDLMGQTPTFASDERDDTRPNLPAAVFLREAPVSPITATRRRLSPAASPGDPGLASFAAAAVDAYAVGGLRGIAPLRRAGPPADLAEVREWAEAAQFAPGVLADLTRLPELSESVLSVLAAAPAIGRIEATAAAAPPGDLAQALDGPLPEEVMRVLLREGVARVLSVPGDPALLDRLAQFGPLPADLFPPGQPRDFDQFVQVTRRLVAPGDRRPLLERMAQDIPLSGLIRWIDEHAAADPGAALAAYSALCMRAPKASEEDLRMLFGLRALAPAVRSFAESTRQASMYLVTLLRALPKRALGLEVVSRLADGTEPALLHALDTVADRQAREVIHRQVRLAYYRSHHLPEPTASLADVDSADQKPLGRARRFGRRDRAANHRKPM